LHSTLPGPGAGRDGWRGQEVVAHLSWPLAEGLTEGIEPESPAPQAG
jgi:hypothetical protein